MLKESTGEIGLEPASLIDADLAAQLIGRLDTRRYRRLSLEDRGDDGGAVNGVGDGLAHVDVVEGSTFWSR